MESSELVYGDFIPDALKAKILEMIHERLDGFSFIPNSYQSLTQAILDEAAGKVQTGVDFPGEKLERQLMFLFAIIISRVKGGIEVSGAWEPELAYKVLAKRLSMQVD